MEIADLTEAEQATLGPWQTRLAKALTDELGVPKVYSVSLGEQPGFHLHFHLIPRPSDLAPEYQGARIFGLLGPNDTAEDLAERDDLAKRLRARLT
jgi:diadenosine tetraphosphate (Ap4A) HIT family hydrolase